MCLGVLSACMTVHHMSAVPVEARRGYWVGKPKLRMPYGNSLGSKLISIYNYKQNKIVQMELSYIGQQ